MNIKDKVVAITGAGNGIGRELSIQCVEAGAKVALLDLSMEALEQTADLAGRSKVSLHAVNITDLNRVKELPGEIISKLGQIDVLINCAGIIQPFVPVMKLSYEEIDRVMKVNFSGTVYMCKEFLPFLLERPEAHIVNVSSMGGFIPFPGQTVYSASKGAVKMFTEGLYAEFKDTKVGVSIIHPGAIRTNIMKNSGLEQKDVEGSQTLPAPEAARQILRAIERKDFRAMVGKDARFLDVFYRLNPKRAIDFIVAKMGVR
jgi:short-subunit dehydrogenase